ncbi:MAG: hypothetical protein JW880_04365 [Candidatus Thermoplasmatota archaeon]|nr:hypothetical protein [Candidatus Thermoplasmatota archaeon]
MTHAALEYMSGLPEWMAGFKQAAGGANLVGFFDCQGGPAKGVKSIMRIPSNKKSRTWPKMDESKGQPDHARLEKA